MNKMNTQAPQMNTLNNLYSKDSLQLEERLALDLLSESKDKNHLRRFEVVKRFVAVYGVLPKLDQIIRDLPRQDKIISHVKINENLKEDIVHYETLLQNNPTNAELIGILDNLYDLEYRGL